MAGPNVLILGFYGMSNIGSEIRLVQIIRDIQSVRPDAQITVVSVLDYRQEKVPNVRYVCVHSTSFGLLPRVFWHIAQADSVLIGEGVPFNSFVGEAFLLFFIPCLIFANLLGKLTAVYAVDCDPLGRMERQFLRLALGPTDLVVARSRDSLRRLIETGARASLGADPVFLYRGAGKRDILGAKKRIRIGFAFINHFALPVKIRPWGKREMLYSYPYYYTYPGNGLVRCREFVREVADAVSRNCSAFETVFIAMDEKFDRKINEEIMSRVMVAKKGIVSYSSAPLADINRLLGTLDVLVSSRLHAIILASNFAVPCIAASVDERFLSFAHDAKMRSMCIDINSAGFSGRLCKKIDHTLKNQRAVSESMRKANTALKQMARRNRALLSEALGVFPSGA